MIDTNTFSVKDKKRANIYFLPNDGFFKAAFMFGNKALKDIIKSDVSDVIKTELRKPVNMKKGVR